MTHRTSVWDLLGPVLAAVLGFTAVVLPVCLDPGARQREAAFLPFVATAVEGMKTMSMALLFAAGAVAGLVGNTRFWIVGASTMAAFPLWSATDVVVAVIRGAEAGHSLLGLKWIIYAVLSLFGVAGASVSRLARRTLTSGRKRGNTI